LLAVVHALVRGCELVGISLGVVGQRDVPCQWGDGELCASWGGGSLTFLMDLEGCGSIWVH
jgi:hypothetical protein